MRIVRFVDGFYPRYGVIEGELIHILDGEPFGGRVEYTGDTCKLDEQQLLAPVTPSKVVCVGKNYREHVREMGSDMVPEAPVLLLKMPSTVIGPDHEIIYPSESQQVDYEGELAVVIGREMEFTNPEDALRFVLGYTCACDVTARDLQKKDGQWTRAKGFRSFCPLGPWIETDLDPSGLVLTTRLNNEIKQAGNTGDMIFDIPTLLSFITQVMPLNPGDVVLTGTPAGIGPMKPGDAVEVTIEGIGTLSNLVVMR